MSRFLGGSAFSMARDIADGFVQVSERTYKSMGEGEMAQLAHEIDRHMRELRGESGVQEGAADLQARQRRIMRLRHAMTVMQAYQQKTRRHG